MIERILAVMGLSAECKPIPGEDQAGWRAYRFSKHDGSETPMPVLLFEHRAKTISDAKRQVSNIFHCVALFHLKSDYVLFFKSGSSSVIFRLDSDDACEQIQTAITAADFASASSGTRARLSIKDVIKNIPTTTKNFNNRGVFSTHYLKGRLLAGNAGATADGLEGAWEGNTQESLRLLGWTGLKYKNGVYHSPAAPHAAILIVAKGLDFGMQRGAGDVAPSYKAIAELRNTPWVILTDGMTWRLYTSRVSASTTNYFEINLETRQAVVLRYLAAIFGAASYVDKGGKTGIDVIFDDGKNYVQDLEENLAERILKPDGVFVDLVKGMLNHDRRRRYTGEDLQAAKEMALKIMYRIWFLLYAESRDLLPVKDERYTPLSLTQLRHSLDGMEEEQEADSCWRRVLDLFRGIRNGSRRHNLPQYSGELFRNDPRIDHISIKNKYFVRALRGLFERDGEPVDYASLGVRHLGHIYETLMEFVVRQADRDIMLLEDRGGVREVSSRAESTYSYKKNDIYIASKAGYVSRKSTGSYYTPEKVVEFLVKRGLEPILQERERLIGNDLRMYGERRTDQRRAACMDRLLDIQVLDPAMGSGHFLVEALNQITRWATGVLEGHPNHPLLGEIEKDRQLIISTQKKQGITINQSLLTHDVLLKRRIMKRCIFGVDVNPLAVELARVSLWLDSFAIGVPLTYLNHHIKTGDSTIGAWRSQLGGAKGGSLDDWMSTTDRVGSIMGRVSRSADVTIEQVRASEDAHDEYERSMTSHKRMLDIYCASHMDESIIPRKARKNIPGYIRRFAEPDTKDADMQHTIEATRKLHDRYKFFHWELEMMDAFTDARYGFDLIIGNPPWDKSKPYDDEFFTPYYPPFRSINTKPKKRAKQRDILEDAAVKSDYDAYVLSFREKSAFYKTYEMQGDGDKDLWQLVLERMLGLVGEGGIISVLIPSQILSNTGSAKIRQHIIGMDIRQMYVFENRKKIFPIHSSYRFLLLTLHNLAGQDTFKAGFYLHDLASLDTDKAEQDKFHTISKATIRAVSPNMLQIPEIGGRYLDILAKMSGGARLGSESGNGWGVELSSGFHRTNDANILKDSGRGWPVLEGKNIHQFNHIFSRPEFVASMSAGLSVEKRKRVYKNNHRQFYHSFRLTFRRVASPTNMRAMIASITPPQRFHTNSIISVVLTRNGIFEANNDYNRHTAYLCGIVNSISFDFAARAKMQMDTPTIIKTIPLPNKSYYDHIVELAAKLSVGTDEFEGFAESLRVENVPLSPPERIHITARLDALVALAYGLTKDEYQTILESFKFDENPALLEAESADLNDNKTLRQFYGEVRRLAPQYYNEIVEGGP